MLDWNYVLSFYTVFVQKIYSSYSQKNDASNDEALKIFIKLRIHDTDPLSISSQILFPVLPAYIFLQQKISRKLEAELAFWLQIDNKSIYYLFDYY